MGKRSAQAKNEEKTGNVMDRSHMATTRHEARAMPASPAAVRRDANWNIR